MSDEALPIEDEEYLLRRIHRNHFDTDQAMPVSAVAFRPNQNDTTGLSVFRERFVNPEDALAGLDADKRNDYYIARLPMSALRRLGLTAVPEPDADGPPGHTVIPELSHAAYHADKQRLKEVQVELARLASQNIVHKPS